MSAGHPHRRPNRLAHTRDLHRMLKAGDAQRLMQRWQTFNFDHDIVYLCGYNVWGTVRYADRDFVHALYDPDYARQILGEPIDTGMSPDDTLECCLWHEAVEKVLLDADNPINDYECAHEFASAAEDERVSMKGGNPLKYNRGLAKIISFCEKKPLRHVPLDYDCEPLVDDVDAEDRRKLRDLHALGIADSFKTGKNAVDYGKSIGHDQCHRCEHWLGGREAATFGLAPCGKVSGLVRDKYWCELYEEREGAPDDQADSQGPQGNLTKDIK